MTTTTKTKKAHPVLGWIVIICVGFFILTMGIVVVGAVAGGSSAASKPSATTQLCKIVTAHPRWLLKTPSGITGYSAAKPLIKQITITNEVGSTVFIGNKGSSFSDFGFTFNGAKFESCSAS